MIGGLVALRDTRTPLCTNLLQFGMRFVLLTIGIGRIGVIAIPLAFTTTVTLETLILGSLCLTWIRQKERDITTAQRHEAFR
jgi:putative peptidoglycan lipid II flippase